MAQSDKTKFQSIEPKLDIEYKEELSYNDATVSIRNTIDAIFKVTGAVTGKIYVFHGAGSVQDVDVKDKDELLNKKRGRACCGGTSGKPIFVLA